MSQSQYESYTRIQSFFESLATLFAGRTRFRLNYKLSEESPEDSSYIVEYLAGAQSARVGSRNMNEQDMSVHEANVVAFLSKIEIDQSVRAAQAQEETNTAFMIRSALQLEAARRFLKTAFPMFNERWQCGIVDRICVFLDHDRNAYLAEVVADKTLRVAAYVKMPATLRTHIRARCCMLALHGNFSLRRMIWP